MDRRACGVARTAPHQPGGGARRASLGEAAGTRRRAAIVPNRTGDGARQPELLERPSAMVEVVDPGARISEACRGGVLIVPGRTRDRRTRLRPGVFAALDVGRSLPPRDGGFVGLRRDRNRVTCQYKNPVHTSVPPGGELLFDAKGAADKRATSRLLSSAAAGLAVTESGPVALRRPSCKLR
jgi:hypothetical protein